MKPTKLIGTKPGGQGKTLAAQLLALGHRVLKDPLETAAVDVSPMSGRRSKLGRLWPETREFAISADFSKIMKSSAAAIEHFDELGARLLRGGVIVDLGANVLPSVLDWADRTDPWQSQNEVAPIWLIVPSTSQHDALEAAKYSLNLSQALDFDRRILLLNMVHGSPDWSPNAPIHRLRWLEEHGKIEAVRLLKCESKLLPLLEAKSMPIHAALKMSDEQASREFGLGLDETIIGLELLRKWVFHQLKTFQAARLLPAGRFSGKKD
ncbi:MAG: hypothetical protein P4M15_12245 [Alphaproteobacteria bacterium]|nr:hypothetical protein [Alphaproteobacteria bacterium]